MCKSNEQCCIPTEFYLTKQSEELYKVSCCVSSLPYIISNYSAIFNKICFHLYLLLML